MKLKAKLKLNKLASSQLPNAIFSSDRKKTSNPEKVVTMGNKNNNKISKAVHLTKKRNQKNSNNVVKTDKIDSKLENPSPLGEEKVNYVADIEGFYDRLIKEAPYIPGDKMELIPVSEIPWANLSLMKEGVTFGMKNFISLLIANTAALMFGFSVKPDSAVLLRSGKFMTSESSFLRYLSTGRRIGYWYMTDLSDINSEGYKQIKIVRQLHAYYAKSKKPLPSPQELGYQHKEMKVLLDAIHGDLASLEIPDAPTHLLTWDPPLPFSQFDVAMTQFGFIGLIYLYPESFGVNEASYDELMDGFMHFWAIIGRLMGLEDRFNLALHCNSNGDKTLFKKLYHNIAMASLKSTDERVICLQTSLMDGLRRRLPWLSLKGWIYYGFKEEPVNNFVGTQVWDLMGFRDKAFYYSMKWTMVAIRKSSVLRIMVTVVFGLLLQLSYWVYLPKEGGCPVMM